MVTNINVTVVIGGGMKKYLVLGRQGEPGENRDLELFKIRDS